MSFGFGFGFPRRLTSGGGLSPSLYLDFVGTNSLPSTVTFSRGTNATLTDSNGRVAYAPHNLLTNSESFEAAAWAKSAGASVSANSTIAPDGTLTADTVTFAASSDFINQQILSYSAVNGQSVTFSIYARTATQLIVFGGASPAGTDVFTATAVGGGWFRQVVTRTFTVTVSGTLQLLPAGLIIGAGSFPIWGAQLNIGSTAQSYNSTTPKNLLGFTQEPENAAWTKSNSYVQQNLLTWSQDFDNAAWNKGNVTVTANAAIAPDGSATADNLVTVATTAITGPFTVAGVASATNTQSFYVKQNVGIRYVQLLWTSSGTSSDYADFDLQTGTLTAGSYAGASITAAGNGWYRISLTSALSATAGGPWLIAIPTSTAGRGATYVGNGTDALFVWGAQLVQGSTAGDYTQTTSAAAPTRYVNWDGTLTGRKLVETTAASTVHQISQIYSGAVASGVYTFNVYLAKGERDKAVMIVSDNSTGDCRVVVDLIAGTVGAPTVTGNWTTASATIQPASGGFFRVGITCTKSAAGNTSVVPIVGLYTTSSSYTGDGTSGIYVSDFQLSNSASVDPYVYNPQAAAASTAYYGPRFDYDPVTLAAKGLLIEEQRTNLFQYSEYFDDVAWSKGGATISADSTSSPNGNNNADRLVEDTSTGDHRTFQIASFTSGTAYTFSVYAKASGRNLLQLANTMAGGFASTFDLTAGTVTNTATGTATITNAGNGWYRCSVSNTSGVTGSSNNQIRLVDTGTNTSYTGNGTSGIFIWGAQLEAGSFATSYIPTVASQVTRNADSASMLGDNFYTWYNPNQGTLSAEVTPYAVAANTLITSFDDGSSANRILIWGTSSGSATRYEVRAGAVTQVNESAASTLIANATTKAAAAYKVNDFAFSVNGGAAVLDGVGTVPAVNKLNIGGITGASLPTGTIRRIGYYSTRLPNSTLQALTS